MSITHPHMPYKELNLSGCDMVVTVSKQCDENVVTML